MAGGGGILPMRDDADVLAELVKENENFNENEPQVAANIGQQMFHMDLPILPRGLRARIRDISLRVRPENAVLVGGGSGHLAAWLLDAWAAGEQKHPTSFRIIEEGGKFGVILDRLIRRYNASSWATVIATPWSELVAETSAWNAASASIESASINKAPLPSPTGLIVIDVPETERPSSLRAALDLVERDGVILILEPEVPTGDVGEFPPGKPTTPAQERVDAFNDWMRIVREAGDRGFKSAFVELSGATLVVMIGP